MLLSTPGLVLHTTPYRETSVVAKVFTRQLGLRSYIVKGVRGSRGRVKQNMLQPLTSLDMVVYENPKSELNYIKEMTLRHPGQQVDAVANALRFFMTEVLYKALREAEPMPDLWDYAEQQSSDNEHSPAHVPIVFLLKVAHHLGIEPMDNHGPHSPYFDLQEGRFVPSPTETTLAPGLSETLHFYLCPDQSCNYSVTQPLQSRRDLIDSLLAYYHFHLSGFSRFHSNEILHTILK